MSRDEANGEGRTDGHVDCARGDSPDAHVHAWEIRETRGWDGDGPFDPRSQMPIAGLQEALETEWDTDAHFCPALIELPSGDLVEHYPRINQPALGTLEKMGLKVVFEVYVIDVDDTVAHAKEKLRKAKGADPALLPTPAGDAWRSEQKEKVLRLDKAGLTFYETFGGYRLIWTLSRRVNITEYLSLLASARSELLKVGIVADARCVVAWNHCYRFPYVVRPEKPFHGEMLPFGGVRIVPDNIVSRDPPRRSIKVGAADCLSHRPHAPQQQPRVTMENVGALVAAAQMPLHEGVPIHENRNSTLTRFAGKWRQDESDHSRLRERLHKYNIDFCRPPLDPHEVDGIANSATRWPVT